MVEIKKIIKRDSRTESFNPEKIKLSIKASFDCAGVGASDEEVAFLTQRAIDWLRNTSKYEIVKSTQVSAAVSSVLPQPARDMYMKATNVYYDNAIAQLDKAYDDFKGTYTDRLTEAHRAFNQLGLTAISEAEFWKRVAYKMADSADSLFKQMVREHEHFLAYKFELDEKEKEFKFAHKQPTEIFQQWEDQKAKARSKQCK